MLSAEILKGVTGLEDSQIEQIIKLSENDENAVIGKRIREVYDRIDDDFEKATGTKKPQDVKTYDHWPNLLASLKDQPTKLNAEIEKLKSEKAEIESQLKDGKGDAVLKSKLSDMERALQDEKDKVRKIRGEYDNQIQELSGKVEAGQSQLQNYRISSLQDQDLAGVSFLETIPKEVVQVMIQKGKDSVTSKYKPEWQKNGDVDVLVFRGEDDKVVLDPENGHNPMTAGKLLLHELTPIIDTGKTQTGTGTGNTGTPAKNTVTLSGAKTQVEADQIIRNQLMEGGLSTQDPSFEDKVVEIRKENKVADLPLQ